MLGATNPDREASFLKSGYKVLAPEFFHDEKRLHVLPMILDLRQLNDRFLDFVRQHSIECVLGSFERQFHAPGESVIRRGDEGGAAYVIVEGRVGVSVSEGGPILDEIGPGELFGELALLTSRPRTANVVALSDLELMVLERDAFHEQLLRDPVAANTLLELLANRFAAVIERRATPGPP